MTGPKNAKGETTWGGLAEEVRYWGNWVLEKVKAEIGDLYPLIPDPAYQGEQGKKGGTGRRPVQAELFTRRRNLPHWEMGGSTYFLTYRCADGRTLAEADRDIVLDNWCHWHGERYLLHCAVVMPDHVHVLITPLKNGPDTWHPLEEILHTNKGFTAQQINKRNKTRGSIWQDERFDRIVRDEEEFWEKWSYIANNPVKEGLAKEPLEYRWLYQNPASWEEGTGQRPVPPEHVPPEPMSPESVSPEIGGASGTGGSPGQDKVPPSFLVPVAYLWTRTVRCKNPTCGATVPLVRQTWLCKKKDRFVALKMIAGSAGGSPAEKKVRFEVVEARTEKGLGFDPAGFSKGGNATCPFCGTVADSDYVKAVGRATGSANRPATGSTGLGRQLMAIVCTRPGRQGKVYLSEEQAVGQAAGLSSTGGPPVPPEEEIKKRIEALCRRTGLTVPSEPITNDAKSANYCVLYGLTDFGDLFTPRQMLCLLTFAAAVRECVSQASRLRLSEEHIKAVATYLGVLVNRLADKESVLARWDNTRENCQGTFGRQALPMVWDFVEPNPTTDASGGAEGALDWIIGVAEAQAGSGHVATVSRGSATALPWPGGTGCQPVFDAVITDPPYYDNVDYAKLSDFFYVWLRRTVGHLYPEHFATEGTPKKNEAVADPVRHGGSKEKARLVYEQMMAQSFREAHRVLKPAGQMIVVYAHKTTLGWATLVDALRQAGFTVTEAWPLDTEMKSRLVAMETAALASSIFLVARKRGGQETGSYEDVVRPELEQIVRERVDSLWKMGITGADLVIAAVGAGLRAFTRFARVEYANGEEVQAEKFLAEVEGVVLKTLLEKIFGMPGSGVATVDGPSRFYVLWRYAYKAAEMDAGEAIVFTYGQNVELDGQNGLSTGRHALVEKKKGKYRLRDFTERGADEKLGLPDESQDGQPVPLIDALHRLLWLVENRPRKLNKFLDEARPDRERLRLVAQALAGKALSGDPDDGSERGVITTAAEQAALKKLVANWRALIDQRLAMDEGTLFDIGRKSHDEEQSDFFR